MNEVGGKQRIEEFGSFGLMMGAIITEVGRSTLSFPLFFVPIVGPILGPIVGFAIGVFSSIGFFVAYKVVFKVNFTERLLSRGMVYLAGDALPFGTIGATAITIWLTRRHDARYNKEALKLYYEGSGTRTPLKSFGPGATPKSGGV